MHVLQEIEETSEQYRWDKLLKVVGGGNVNILSQNLLVMLTFLSDSAEVIMV